jgi:hypothetical protein
MPFSVMTDDALKVPSHIPEDKGEEYSAFESSSESAEGKHSNHIGDKNRPKSEESDNCKNEEEAADIVSTDEFMSSSVAKRIMESKPLSDNYSFISQPKQISEEQQIEIATKVLQMLAENMHRNGWSVNDVFDLE